MFAGAEGKARFGYLLEGNDNDGGKGGGEGPTLHVYCFSKAADPERDALDVRAVLLYFLLLPCCRAPHPHRTHHLQTNQTNITSPTHTLT